MQRVIRLRGVGWQDQVPEIPEQVRLDIGSTLWHRTSSSRTSNSISNRRAGYTGPADAESSGRDAMRRLGTWGLEIGLLFGLGAGAALAEPPDDSDGPRPSSAAPGHLGDTLSRWFSP